MDFDIKARFPNLAAMLNGLYVTSRSAGNYLAGLNASTGKLLGKKLGSYDDFQKLAGALHKRNKRPTPLEAVLILNGFHEGKAPLYGENNYQRRMSLEGWMDGRP